MFGDNFFERRRFGIEPSAKRRFAKDAPSFDQVYFNPAHYGGKALV
jgi:hypothetical protein